MCSYPSWLNNRQRYLGHRLSGASRSAPRATARPWSVPVPVSSGVTDASIFTLLVSLDLKIGNQKKKKKNRNQSLKPFDFFSYPPTLYFWTWSHLHLKKLFAVKHRWEGMVTYDLVFKPGCKIV